MTKIASIIILIWILGILAVLPTTFATVIYKFHFSDTELIMKEICAEKWPHPVAHLLYSVGLMIVQVIISFLYGWHVCNMVIQGMEI